MNTPVTAPVVGTPEAPVVAPADNAQWFAGVDTETAGYIQNRGLDKGDAKSAFLNASKAHREAERLLGTGVQNLVKLPKDINDTATRDALWNKIGRPEKAEGYDFAGIEGVDEGFTKFASPIFHAHGVTKDAARAITKAFIDEATKAQADAQKANEAQLTVERNALLKDWGGAADANLIVGQEAWKKLGISAEESQAIEKVLGFGKTMRLAHNLGTKIGEDVFVNPDVANGGPPRIINKAQATARKAELMRDKDWANKYLAGSAQENKEMTALNALISSQ